MGKSYRKVDYVTAIKCIGVVDNHAKESENMRDKKDGDKGMTEVSAKDKKYMEVLIKLQVNEDMFKRGVINENTYYIVKAMLNNQMLGKEE